VLKVCVVTATVCGYLVRRTWTFEDFEPELPDEDGCIWTWRGGLKFRSAYQSFRAKYPDRRHIMRTFFAVHLGSLLVVGREGGSVVDTARPMYFVLLRSPATLACWSDGVSLTSATRAAHPWVKLLMNFPWGERFEAQNKVLGSLSPSTAVLLVLSLEVVRLAFKFWSLGLCGRRQSTVCYAPHCASGADTDTFGVYMVQTVYADIMSDLAEYPDGEWS
jgi:hypothetical protein